MVTLYDTTLRDGTQRENLSLSVEDKLRICQRLDDLGIDYIEGGWPGSNPKDTEFFERARDLELEPRGDHARSARRGARTLRSKRTRRLRRCCDTGARRCASSARRGTCTSPRRSRPRSRRTSRWSPTRSRYLKEQGRTVFFDAEHFFDGYANNAGYAIEVCQAAAEAGADAVVLCDTNGGTMPQDDPARGQRRVRSWSTRRSASTRTTTPGAPSPTRCSRSTRAACTCRAPSNGYGERAGNANLMTIIPSLVLKMGDECITREQLKLITEVSHFVAETANISPEPHQPYVGASAFAHKGGMHASAAARLPEAYEHIDPAAVGNLARVVVSEMAGRAILTMKAKEMGIDLDGRSRDGRRRARLHQGAGARGLLASRPPTGRSRSCSASNLGTYEPFFDLESFRCIMEKREDGKVMTEATIKIHVGGHRYIATAEGNGPVNALDKALRIAIGEFYPHLDAIELTDFKVRVLDEKKGTGAVTRVLIESSDGEKSWGTVGVSENIIEASWEALVDSVEYGLSHPRETGDA